MYETQGCLSGPFVPKQHNITFSGYPRTSNPFCDVVSQNIYLNDNLKCTLVIANVSSESDERLFCVAQNKKGDCWYSTIVNVDVDWVAIYQKTRLYNDSISEM